MNSRFQQERRQPPYYLLTGLLLGLVIGFVVTMVVFPVQYTNVPPETLNINDKDQYRLMIAMAFQANQDLGRASARLGLLRDDDIAGQLIQQSRRSQLRSDAQVLLNLAQAIQNPYVQPVLNQNPTEFTTSETNSIAITSTITATVLPEEENNNSQDIRTATPQPARPQPTTIIKSSPTALAMSSIPFQLSEKQTICNPTYQESLIQVEVFNRNGDPIPNSRITVYWSNGQDSFYTGYFPEISAGYADFNMSPPTIYSVRVGEIGELVTNLSAPECKNDADNSYWGSLYLRFDEP